MAIIKIVGIARRIGIFVDVRLGHFGFFTVSPVVEEWFLGNYVRWGGLIWIPAKVGRG